MLLCFACKAIAIQEVYCVIHRHRFNVDPSRQRKGEGSGIGLAIVKSIIEAHQGKISVVSDEVSTRFTFYFHEWLPEIQALIGLTTLLKLL
ncbi:hypothetical protein HCM71_003721 [Salmonella enterica subsp. salamae]|nr:hypothetical protein [Salmonella enterica subsp. salamae]EGB7051678.1 hypothetical protein [Salmonella enterica]